MVLQIQHLWLAKPELSKLFNHTLWPEFFYFAAALLPQSPGQLILFCLVSNGSCVLEIHLFTFDKRFRKQGVYLKILHSRFAKCVKNVLKISRNPEIEHSKSSLRSSKNRDVSKVARWIWTSHKFTTTPLGHSPRILGHRAKSWERRQCPPWTRFQVIFWQVPISMWSEISSVKTQKMVVSCRFPKFGGPETHGCQGKMNHPMRRGPNFLGWHLHICHLFVFIENSTLANITASRQSRYLETSVWLLDGPSASTSNQHQFARPWIYLFWLEGTFPSPRRLLQHVLVANLRCC